MFPFIILFHVQTNMGSLFTVVDENFSIELMDKCTTNHLVKYLFSIIKRLYFEL